MLARLPRLVSAALPQLGWPASLGSLGEQRQHFGLLCAPSLPACLLAGWCTLGRVTRACFGFPRWAIVPSTTCQLPRPALLAQHRRCLLPLLDLVDYFVFWGLDLELYPLLLLLLLLLLLFPGHQLLFFLESVNYSLL